MDLILSLLQQMCVYLVLAYMLSKTPIFLPLLNISSRISHKISTYVLFSLFCIMGTYFGLQINDAIANTRAIGAVMGGLFGAVMGGLFGGPIVGFAVGFTGGMHRYTLGGFTDVACAISTTAEGLIGGLLHTYLLRKGKGRLLFSPSIVFAVTLFAEIVQMLVILLVAKPFVDAYALVSTIAAPMIIANSVGAALFMSILQDRKTIFEEYSATFSRRALNIAERSVGILANGFNPHNAGKVARIVYEMTNVGAVSITDREKILAFIGIGDDHHKPNTPISSQSTLDAITKNRIIYLDGKDSPYQCSLSKNCKLGSALIIPLRAGDRVIGTIKLYEPKRKLFSTINMSMAEGIAQLLSSQILYGEYQQKQMLLSRAEIKLLHAQVNPHFLFNALNTISAITRRDPDKARELIQHLSHFFRSNLKQNIETVTLKEELAHVKAYLTIEQARFADRLEVDIAIDDALLLERNVPSFTLQPLVENAIKHGTSNLLEGGRVRIYSQAQTEGYKIVVEDNAGSYQAPNEDYDGLGMQIVNKRLTNKFGEQAALKTEVLANQYTRMSFLIPHQGFN
ncbi:sensor histidine kinase [Vibrio anguillarum]|uniref:sensor histidine kinase n=2 Tax=Vibrio anguillarum TaxID=55601 RepID=UPI000980530A|nr:sensor histidine kinase [Vibrio anguillarum]MBT2978183.1 sensor histidine kinase [Vibrio anguillarum]